MLNHDQLAIYFLCAAMIFGYSVFIITQLNAKVWKEFLDRACLTFVTVAVCSVGSTAVSLVLSYTNMIFLFILAGNLPAILYFIWFFSPGESKSRWDRHLDSVRERDERSEARRQERSREYRENVTRVRAEISRGQDGAIETTASFLARAAESGVSYSEEEVKRMLVYKNGWVRPPPSEQEFVLWGWSRSTSFDHVDTGTMERLYDRVIEIRKNIHREREGWTVLDR